MWIAGLRGAMAYALAMESSHSSVFNHPGKASGDVMLVITILYAIFTILGVGSFLHPIMTKCGVTSASKNESVEEERSEIEKDLIAKIHKSKE